MDPIVGIGAGFRGMLEAERDAWDRQQNQFVNTQRARMLQDQADADSMRRSMQGIDPNLAPEEYAKAASQAYIQHGRPQEAMATQVQGANLRELSRKKLSDEATDALNKKTADLSEKAKIDPFGYLANVAIPDFEQHAPGRYVTKAMTKDGMQVTLWDEKTKKPIRDMLIPQDKAVDMAHQYIYAQHMRELGLIPGADFAKIFDLGLKERATAATEKQVTQQGENQRGLLGLAERKLPSEIALNEAYATRALREPRGAGAGVVQPTAEESALLKDLADKYRNAPDEAARQKLAQDIQITQNSINARGGRMAPSMVGPTREDLFITQTMKDNPDITTAELQQRVDKFRAVNRGGVGGAPSPENTNLPKRGAGAGASQRGLQTGPEDLGRALETDRMRRQAVASNPAVQQAKQELVDAIKRNDAKAQKAARAKLKQLEVQPESGM